MTQVRGRVVEVNAHTPRSTVALLNDIVLSLRVKGSSGAGDDDDVMTAIFYHCLFVFICEAISPALASATLKHEAVPGAATYE